MANRIVQRAILVAGLFLPSAPACAGQFKTIEVSKANHQERSNGCFQVEVSEGSYGRVNFTVHLKKNPLDALVSSGLSRIEIIEHGQPAAWIPTERRQSQDDGSPYLHFELSPQMAYKSVLVLVELTGDAAGNVYRVNLYSFTKEGALDPAPGLEEVVNIHFPQDGYRFSASQVAKGVTLDYDISVSQDVQGVIALPFGPSFAESPGPSRLYPREKISGNGQLYCLEDFGLGRPAAEKDHSIQTIKKGTYAHTFPWDGRNWTGPSDTGIPKGEPFPRGTYEVTVTIHGSRMTSQGRVPYEISRQTKLVLE
jgi:hypothetical protein